MITPFHLAIPVSDIETARAFYGGLLGCAEGRSSDQWVDFNLFGHQLVCHEVSSNAANATPTNPVDGHDVPVPHFGAVSYTHLTLRRLLTCRSRWSPYH